MCSSVPKGKDDVDQFNFGYSLVFELKRNLAFSENNLVTEPVARLEVLDLILKIWFGIHYSSFLRYEIEKQVHFVWRENEECSMAYDIL